MKKYLHLAFLIAFSILPSACGFHLRGKIELPPEMSKVYIQAKDNRLAGQLGRGLVTSGATIVKDMTQATAVVKIYNVSEGRNVRSVGGTGRVREYSLVYSVDFDIRDASGKIIMKRQSASLSRDLSFNEAQVVGKSVEESIIREEMRRQMISELLRRMQRFFQSRQRLQATGH